jgi:flagellar biosynthesis/type III secretory pathway ATPase
LAASLIWIKAAQLIRIEATALGEHEALDDAAELFMALRHFLKQHA